AVMSGVQPLIKQYEQHGMLRGRYDKDWQPTVSWRCLTGEAQVALVLERLAQITGDNTYAERATSLLEGVARLQDMDDRYPESYGAVPGSEPLWGGYGPF